VGELFPLFPPQRTEQRAREPGWGFDHVPTFLSAVALDTDGLLPMLPVEFWAIADGADMSQAVTPFEPDLGYHVTMEDFDPAAREQKVNAPPYLGRQFAPIPEAPSSLSAYITAEGEDLSHLLMDRSTNRVATFLPEVAEELSRLQFHVFFPPGLRFAADPEIGNGTVVYYDAFYPFDTGPLAVPETGVQHLWTHGLQLAVPPDPARLAQVQGRFVLR
jgi:hypothetical protein